MNSNGSLLKVSIYYNNFRHNPKIDGYVTFISDMNELHEIVTKNLKRGMI